MSKVPPLTLLLAQNEPKPTQTSIIHYGAKWRKPKRHITAQDLLAIPQDLHMLGLVSQRTHKTLGRVKICPIVPVCGTLEK